MTPTSERRAERARRAMLAYKGTEPGASMSAEMIIDLLTDLHHAMDEQHQIGIDELLDGWLRCAHDHFAMEKKR